MIIMQMIFDFMNWLYSKWHLYFIQKPTAIKLAYRSTSELFEVCRRIGTWKSPWHPYTFCITMFFRFAGTYLYMTNLDEHGKQEFIDMVEERFDRDTQR